MTKTVVNVPASVRARLLRRAKELPEDFSLLLQRYAAERFLYRLSQTPHRSHFVLKGAMLFAVWDHSLYRSTRDLDLGGFGAGDGPLLATAIRTISAIAYPDDGIEFLTAGIQVDPIRDASEEVGHRVRLQAVLDGAQIRLQIDVGYGDAIGRVVEVDYPTLLDTPAPRIQAYSREAVVAEKLHAMVAHGSNNTRFKDFFDLKRLAERFEFDRITLADAIRMTFERRRMAIPAEDPIALTKAFWRPADRPGQLRAFGRRARIEVGTTTGEEILVMLQSFLLPVLDDLRRRDAAKGTWPPGGPWR